MELTPEIRERLKTAMANKKETGYTINAKLGISATTIGNYLNGKIKKADKTKLKVICDLLGITLEWLQYGQDLVKTPAESGKEGSSQENTDQLLKQIVLLLSSKDEQYVQIRRELEKIRTDINEIKKYSMKDGEGIQ